MSASVIRGSNVSSPSTYPLEMYLGDIESICHLDTNEKKHERI